MCSIIIKNDVVARLNRFQTSRLSSGECNRAFYSCLPAKTSGFAVDQKKKLDLPQSESWQIHLCFHFHFTAQVQRLFITKSLKLASPVHLPRLVGIFVQNFPAKKTKKKTKRHRMPLFNQQKVWQQHIIVR